MQIEIYNMQTENDSIKITLEAICDSFSSLLWDIRYYECGQFEIYIAASPQNIEIFQTGRIIGRDDDSEHFGIIESVIIETDAEDGDYLTVSGRFLMCLLERRIIFPTLNFTVQTSYAEIVQKAVSVNALTYGERLIPGLSIGTAVGDCWNQKTALQISYANLMEWIYTICEKIGGTANIRLEKDKDEQYHMVFELSEGIDRSVFQEENAHIIFSDSYNNLLNFTYADDISAQHNFAYIMGQGEGEARKRTTYCNGDIPYHLDRYEVYVDADDISQEEQIDGETRKISDEDYIELLRERGAQDLVLPKIESESEIAANSTQYVYQRDYFVGDHVTVQHRRFGLSQPKIQLTGMIESFDQNGRKLTPTFALREE